MPFDGRDSTPALNRARLIEALRAKMPSGFEWDYSKVVLPKTCGTAGCAIGLAYQLWPGEIRNGDGDVLDLLTLSRFFGMDMKQIHRVFLSPVTYGFRFYEYERVTPDMVADALERVA